MTTNRKSLYNRQYGVFTRDNRYKQCDTRSSWPSTHPTARHQKPPRCQRLPHGCSKSQPAGKSCVCK